MVNGESGLAERIQLPAGPTTSLERTNKTP
jgi:hypothetical protein